MKEDAKNEKIRTKKKKPEAGIGGQIRKREYKLDCYEIQQKRYEYKAVSENREMGDTKDRG